MTTVAAAPGHGWPILVLDLDEEIVDLPVGGAERVHVTARLRGHPLGACLLEVPMDPFPARLLRDELLRRFSGEIVHRRRRALLPDVAAAGGGASPATVLVCTRDRPDGLRRCLASLSRLGPSVAEVLVVDNGSTTAATREVAEAAGARYVAEPEPGLDRARNRGFAEARTEVVLCTDDDVEVDAGWAVSLLGCFDDPLVMAATGLVLPARLDTPARQAFEQHAGFARGARRRVWDGTEVPATAAGAIGAGASMALRTRFARSVGGFPEELDAGMPTGSGGDTYLLYRVLRAGYRAVYEPAALAFHDHRDDAEALRRVIAGYGTGTYSYLAHAALSDRDPAAARAALRWAARRFVREPVRTAIGRPGAVPLELLLAEAAGSLRALSAYPAARRITAGRERVDPGGAAAPPDRSSRILRAEVTRELPSLSVVVPSRGRRHSLVRLLRALEEQACPAGRLSLVVATDGDADGTPDALRHLALRTPLQVVAVPGATDRQGKGAAAARNAGAAVADGDVVLFLDDDVEPTGDDLLLAHAEVHATAGHPTAVIGACPPAQGDVAGRHAQIVRNWWVDHVRHLTSGAELGFSDLLTGNLSCRRQDFLAVGGFAPLPRREDWELGYRLLRGGIALRASARAEVLHFADLDLASAVGDRRSEGRGDAGFALLHPEAGGLLPLSRWLSLSSRDRARLSLLFRDEVRSNVDVSLRAAVRLLHLLEASGSSYAWQRTHRRAMRQAYWAGVADVLSSPAQLLSLLGNGEGTPDVGATVDLAALQETLPRTPPLHAGRVVVTLDSTVLGDAPLALGGTPWRRQRFATALLDRFGPRGDSVLARMAPQ